MHSLTLACCVLVLAFGYTYAELILREVKRKDLNITKQPEVYSSEWAVHLNDDGKHPKFLEEMGFDVVGQVGNLPGMYSVIHRETHARQQLARKVNNQAFTTPLAHSPSHGVTLSLLSHPNIKWAQQQVLVQHSKRAGGASFPDPLYTDQWHLNNVGQFEGIAGEDVNIIGAWEAGYTGAGVQIAIVDDGYQYTHPDLSANYVAEDSVNFNGKPGSTSDPAPDVTADWHGTAAAGVAMAASNAACGVGAAYEASGAGIRMISGPVSDATEATGMTYHNQVNDIYSNSWGPADEGDEVGGPGTLLLAALTQAVITGRGGKGSVYVWAAGNGGQNNDNCNYDGYANSRFAIAVGAIGNNGKQAYYSEKCAALVVAAPSNSATTDAGIRTTDILGQNGYNQGDCDTDFGGTSSACPLVSGILALILQANSALTWRDLTVILASTARKNDATDSDWISNGRGYHVNHKYGFGAIDAVAAVNAAKTHVLLSSETSAMAQYTTTTTLKPESAAGFTVDLQINQNFIVEKVVISVTIDHPTSGDIQVTLTSPYGTQSVLAEPHANTPVIQLSGSTSVHQIGPSDFGPEVPFNALQGTVVATSPADGCPDLSNCNSLSGAIAYVTVTGTCEFTVRARAVQDCGAIAMLVYNTKSDEKDELKIIPGTDKLVTIPVGFVDYTFAAQQNLPGKKLALGQVRFAANSYSDGWNFSTVRSLGENSQGAWKLNVADPRAQPSGVSGTITNLMITVYGSNSPSSYTSSSPPHFVGFSCCLFGLVCLCIGGGVSDSVE